MVNNIVYTAITGGKDFPKLIQNFKGARFVGFSEEEALESDWKGWRLERIDPLFKDPTRDARRYKILAHQFLECRYSLWIDGSIILITSMPEMVEQYLQKTDIAVFKHRGRDCLYEEAEMVKNVKYDSPEVVDKHMQRYRMDKYPEQNGLHETGVILRRHTKAVEDFNNLWWSEVSTGSRRDQLSFDYCLWKSGLKVTEFPLTIWNNMLVKLEKHNYVSTITS